MQRPPSSSQPAAAGGNQPSAPAPACTAPPAKRVLFVDEDTTTVATLRQAFAPDRSAWDTVFVQSCEEALAQLEASRFDAIVSDLALARMDGSQLLAQVRERHPDVVRLCLSERVDDEAFLRAVPVTHQFLRKPCHPDTVREIIERACSLGELLQNRAVRQLISRLDGLPATPQTYQQLSAAMASPTAHTADISEIVSNDHALSLKTLQIVNSALFRRTGAITSISAAINFVGLEMLRSLALSACVFSAVEASPATAALLADLQARSVRKARCARALLADGHGADEAFTAALLVDVGQAVLALADPGRFATMVQLARRREQPWHLVEAECLGATHPQVGACLLGLWGLPLELVEAVANHHVPSAVEHANTRVLAAVHVADALVDAASGAPQPLSAHVDAQFIARPEVRRCLREWHVDVDADTRSLQRTHAL